MITDTEEGGGAYFQEDTILCYLTVYTMNFGIPM